MNPEEPNICKCRRGYASNYDNKCKFCRENTCGIRRAVLRKYVRHQGDGLRLADYLMIIKDM